MKLTIGIIICTAIMQFAMILYSMQHQVWAGSIAGLALFIMYWIGEMDGKIENQ